MKYQQHKPKPSATPSSANAEPPEASPLIIKHALFAALTNTQSPKLDAKETDTPTTSARLEPSTTHIPHVPTKRQKIHQLLHPKEAHNELREIDHSPSPQVGLY